MTHPDDTQWMARALELADAGAALASPNPTVGCVLVRDGEVVGEGFHQYEFLDHAEIVALKQAKDRAQGVTAYVTLEPCSHHGRTPPCADALVRAGVARVVIATRDPNPLVSGQGIAKLLAADVAITENVLQGQARERNNAFAKWITTGLPFVTLKAAVSADGKIAPAPGTMPPGQRLHLTSADADSYVQNLRAEADAVLTGIATIVTDDPLLTDRSGRIRRRRLLRVIVDSALQLPVNSRIVQSTAGDVVVFHTRGESAKAAELTRRGVQVEQVSAGAERRVSIHAVLRALGERQITSVLTEAGCRLNTTLLRENLADAAVILHTPGVIGGAGVPVAEVPLPAIADASRQLGPDRLDYSVLHAPWPPNPTSLP